MIYHLVRSGQGVRVVDSPGPPRGSGSLALVFAHAKRAAGWGEGGTGLQQVDADVETSILHAFRGLPSPPPRE